MQTLVSRLHDNENLTCPHGRPIAIRITKRDLEKGFKTYRMRERSPYIVVVGPNRFRKIAALRGVGAWYERRSGQRGFDADL